MKQLGILFFLFSVTTLLCAQRSTPQPAPPPSSAEPCSIAFYTRDSIAIQFPADKPKYEAIKNSQQKIDAVRAQQIIATDELLTVQRDSVKLSTPAGKKEKEAALQKVAALHADSLREEKNVARQHELLNPSYKKIDHVADSIGKKYGVKQIRESADNSPMACPTDQVLMIDITNDVAIAMHVKPKLVKIGVFNQDSLLRLLPGYAALADSSKAEYAAFEQGLAAKDRVIAQKQRELDSLRSSLSRKQVSQRETEISKLQDERDTYRGHELYKADLHDSLRTKSYRDKFYKALSEAQKEAGCHRSYTYEKAHEEWTAKEAEFIDLNVVIAGKLGL